MADTPHVSLALASDSAIRGQKFVCVSLIAPRDYSTSREVFDFMQFVDHFASEARQLLSDLEKIAPDPAIVQGLRKRHDVLLGSDDVTCVSREFQNFRGLNYDDLSAKYKEVYGVRTPPSTHALKVRGSFETREEAEEHAMRLSRLDGGLFDIYVADVGCWLPWSPPPHAVGDAHYSSTETLERIMRCYEDNRNKASEHHATRVMTETALAAASGSGRATNPETVDPTDAVDA